MLVSSVRIVHPSRVDLCGMAVLLRYCDSTNMSRHGFGVMLDMLVHKRCMVYREHAKV